jgi:hypothetical protein
MPSTPRQPSLHPRRARRRLAAGLLVSSVAVGGLVIAGGSPASAATAPLAQSAGRFLDGSLGGNPVQQLADLTDARAKSPGTQTTQDPLNATVAGALNVPLTGALQLPTLAGIKLGAANQVAVAHADGYSYGASGAVANSGGVSVGGNNNAYPAGAEIDLDASALGALPTIPVPGASAAGALGVVKVKIGAVSSLAQTKSGGVAVPLGTNHYGIASLSLSLGSPALAGLLGQVTSQASALNALLGPIQTQLGNLFPAGCNLTPGTLPSSISLDSGAIVIDASTGTISLDVAKLLQVLGLNINSLPANTDLLSYVLTQLPTILAAGLPAVVNGIITPLETGFAACVAALPGGLGALLITLTNAKTTIETTLSQVAAGLASAAPGGLGALSTALGQLLSVGVNVQHGPGAGTTNPSHPFTSKLKATTDQADSPVANQTIVRAIEVDLAGAQVAAIALANSAAGPSTKAVVVVVPSTPAPTTTAPVTDVPTKINAGQASPGGNPELPLILLVGALVMAAAGGIAWKIRGTHG